MEKHIRANAGMLVRRRFLGLGLVPPGEAG
jgi:hypothetical protein